MADACQVAGAVMFGFVSNHQKRKEVQQIMLPWMNRVQIRTLDGNNKRGGTRTMLTDIVWALPCAAYPKVDYSLVFAAVTRDISANGISFVHSAEITESRVIVGLNQANADRRFLLCTVKHCTPLDHGFYLVGLLADEVVQVGRKDEEAMHRLIDEHQNAGKEQAPARVKIVG